jgi:hypothetical protein
LPRRCSHVLRIATIRRRARASRSLASKFTARWARGGRSDSGCVDHHAVALENIPVGPRDAVMRLPVRGVKQAIDGAIRRAPCEQDEQTAG